MVVRGGAPEARRAFADALAPELDRLPTVDYVDVRRPTEFFEKRALYFVEKPDLETIRDRLDARLKHEVARAQLDLDDEAAPPVELDDIRRRYEHRLNEVAGASADKSAYYENDSELAVFAHPSDLASNLDFARKVVGDVERTVARVAPAKFGTGLDVELAGRYKKRVNLERVLVRDLAFTGSLALRPRAALRRAAFPTGVGRAPGDDPAALGARARLRARGVRLRHAERADGVRRRNSARHRHRQRHSHARSLRRGAACRLRTRAGRLDRARRCRTRVGRRRLHDCLGVRLSRALGFSRLSRVWPAQCGGHVVLARLVRDGAARAARPVHALHAARLESARATSTCRSCRVSCAPRLGWPACSCSRSSGSRLAHLPCISTPISQRSIARIYRASTSIRR